MVLVFFLSGQYTRGLRAAAESSIRGRSRRYIDHYYMRGMIHGAMDFFMNPRDANSIASLGG